MARATLPLPPELRIVVYGHLLPQGSDESSDYVNMRLVSKQTKDEFDHEFVQHVNKTWNNPTMPVPALPKRVTIRGPSPETFAETQCFHVNVQFDVGGRLFWRVDHLLNNLPRHVRELDIHIRDDAQDCYVHPSKPNLGMGRNWRERTYRRQMHDLRELMVEYFHELVHMGGGVDTISPYTIRKVTLTHKFFGHRHRNFRLDRTLTHGSFFQPTYFRNDQGESYVQGLFMAGQR